MNHIKLLNEYMKNPGGFSILILGERGTGKTREVKLNSSNAITANCASFADDIMAESELFGYAPDSYTGASKKGKGGLFDSADNGILFLDEIHHLSVHVQAKLMTALQTEGDGENKGKFSIRKLGEVNSHFVKVRPIFASNLPLSELKTKLFPDFYDRISQLVVEFPSIRNNRKRIPELFKSVWERMQFEEKKVVPNGIYFNKWLQDIPLEGNYRDLEIIAILWHQGRLMESYKTEEDIFNMFVKTHYDGYHCAIPTMNSIPTNYFQVGNSKKELDRIFHKNLYDWADKTFKTHKLAAKSLKISRLDILLRNTD